MCLLRAVNFALINLKKKQLCMIRPIFIGAFCFIMSSSSSISSSKDYPSKNNVLEDPPAANENIVTKCPAEVWYEKNDRSFTALVSLCMGLKDEEENAVLDLKNDPWKSRKKKAKDIKPSSEFMKRHIIWRWENVCKSSPPMPRPNQWSVPQVMKWFDKFPINEADDVAFLIAEVAKEKELACETLLREQSEKAARQQDKMTSTKRTKDEMSDGWNGNNMDQWGGSNKEAFDRLDHPGYSFESDPDNYLGGWHAHRAVWQTNKDGTDRPPCWIKDDVMGTITKFDYHTMPIGRAPRILVLYGSLRPESFSRKSAYEFARLLDVLGCDVRVYNPRGLPVRDPALEDEPKVKELRALTHWSDGHMWVSPEMHGTITGVFKNQIDWIPLNTGSVRPTQGKTCCVAQVNGGSQSFNAVNVLRQLARWMRMPCSTNQSSVPMAWKEFGEDGRMKDSTFRERVVDVVEEFAKFTAVMVPVKDDLVNRYSERKEKLEKGRLLTQAEKEQNKEPNQAENEQSKEPNQVENEQSKELNQAEKESRKG